MSARVIDFVRPYNALRSRRGEPPVADWGPVEWRNQAVGYALARAAVVYVWPRRRKGTLDSADGKAAAMLRVTFKNGAMTWTETFPASEVHPIPFCLQFKGPEEIEEYLRADAAETFSVAGPPRAPRASPTDQPPGGHAA